MLFDIFIRLFTAPIRGLLMILPSLSIEIPPDVFLQINEYFELACFFLPMEAVMLVLTIKLGLYVFRLAMAVINAVKSFIPTMGG